MTRRRTTAALLVTVLALPAAAIAGGARVAYQGGRVLHGERIHVIFWEPAGSGLVFDPGYQALVEQFLRDLAADSHTTTNVMGLTGEYTDANGPAAYALHFAGAVTDTGALPANGCREPAGSGPGWTVCLTDGQLQQELGRITARRGLPVGGDNVDLLVTPRGFGSCTRGGSSSCALGGRATGYCGYHSVTGGGLVYAVIPYNAIAGHCQSQNPRPNANTADPALSTIAHELAESETDPFGDGWVAANGDEIADVCIADYGPALGGSGDARWDEVIDGGHYWLQELYSRLRRRCEPRPESDTVTIIGPDQAIAGEDVTLAGQASQPGGSIVSYTWRFGTSAGPGHGAEVVHAWRSPGVYRIALKVVDAAGNWAYAGRWLRVTNPGGAIAR